MSEASLPLIPEKVYFRIGEVADLVGVERYVLRYWESEFPQIVPSKSSSQHRMYRREDVDLFRVIKRLLYEEKFTIAGAKQKLMQTTLEELVRPPAAVPLPIEEAQTVAPEPSEPDAPEPVIEAAAALDAESYPPPVAETAPRPVVEESSSPPPVAEAVPAPAPAAPRGPSPRMLEVKRELLDLLQWVEDLEE